MLTETFAVKNSKKLKQQLLTWASRFSSCSFLDNHHYDSAWNLEECLVAAGAKCILKFHENTEVESIQSFIDDHRGEWIFGHFGYEFKNILEGISGDKSGKESFAPIHLYVPEYLVQFKDGSAIIHSNGKAPILVWKEINTIELASDAKSVIQVPQPCITKNEYLETVRKLKDHIHRGDCYEINFCQEFTCIVPEFSPVVSYARLAEISPNPFSCFYHVNHGHLLCASPERFLARRGNKIFSQPIKGTAARNENDADDKTSLRLLLESPKERSENVMVVDLVRNDLSRVCAEGTVNVEELYGIYSYPQVHQMISTISGQLADGISFMDIMKACFPMASMTGAPKTRVIQLVSEYEKTTRGLFSGTVGYIAPSGDFDWNVVIRSLFYNAETCLLSYWVGSGITWYSDPEQEYEECLLKASAIKKVLQ